MGVVAHFADRDRNVILKNEFIVKASRNSRDPLYVNILTKGMVVDGKTENVDA